MKLLIVGGVAFIGKELVKQALDAGHDVTVLALDKPNGQVNWIKANRNDKAGLKEALAGQNFDVIIDNIAYTAKHVEDIVTLMAGRMKRYVLTSTVDTYEYVVDFKDEVLHETLLPVELDPNDKHQDYPRNKRNAETWLRNTPIDVEKVVIRPSMVTGRYDNVGANRSVFFPKRILDGNPILLLHNARSIFHLIHVADLAKALLLAATHPGIAGQTLNAAGNVFTVEQLIRELAASVGMKVEIVRAYWHELNAIGYSAPYQRGDQPGVSIFSTARLESFGWKPTPVAEWGPSLFEGLDLESIKAEREKELTFLKSLDKPINFKPNYASRFNLASYNPAVGRLVSNIGIGTFYGDISVSTDKSYFDSIMTCVAGGINLIDTAINYRDEHSERIVGDAVKALAELGTFRDELFIVTKGGFVPSSMFACEELIHTANKRHCVEARFIDASLRRSLSNLGTHVDAYLLHNPENFAADPKFYEKLAFTFAVLEQAVRDQKIRCYGIATWDGLIVPPGHERHVSLKRVLAAARLAAGSSKHNLKAIELPFNSTLDAAATKQTQDGLTAFDAARAYGLYPLISASVDRGQVPQEFYATTMPDLSPAMRSVQLARSLSNGTALIGMRSANHVSEALALLPLSKAPR